MASYLGTVCEQRDAHLPFGIGAVFSFLAACPSLPLQWCVGEEGWPVGREGEAAGGLTEKAPKIGKRGGDKKVDRRMERQRDIRRAETEEERKRSIQVCSETKKKESFIKK